MVSPSRVLVTGSEGFTGHYVVAEFLSNGYEVIGTTMSEQKVRLAQKYKTVTMDITDEASVTKVLKSIQPDFVIHLAGISFVPHSNVRSIYDINLLGPRNLLNAISELETKPRSIVLASSANVYGNVTAEIISESQPINPANDYGVSKAAMEYLTGVFPDQNICIARPFNYTGTYQNLNFLIPKIISHFKNHAATIELGNLDVQREFNDVRDVAKIYRRLAESESKTTTNICTGRVYSIRHILSLLEKITDLKLEVSINKEFERKSEIARLAGDPNHLINTIGAFDTYTIEETLTWMLESAHYLSSKN